jgi:hypothetical protein
MKFSIRNPHCFMHWYKYEKFRDNYKVHMTNYLFLITNSIYQWWYFLEFDRTV